jgi:O-antigen ligase
MAAITLFFASTMFIWSWWMPNHTSPWVTFHAEAVMVMACGLGLLGELLRNPTPMIKVTRLLFASLLMGCIPVVQFALGLIEFAGDVWIVCAGILAFLLAQIFGQVLAQRLDLGVFFDALVGLLIAASLGSIGVQLYQWLELTGLGIFATDLAPLHAPYANLAQANHLASLLFWGLIGVLYWYERRRIAGLGLVLSVLFFEWGLVMTASRTVWLNMAVLVCMLWLLRRRSDLRMGSPIMLTGLVGSFIVWVYGWPLLNYVLMLSPGRSLQTMVDAAGPRPVIWRTMLDAISQQPWFGYGWNQGLAVYHHVVVSVPEGVRLFANAHNFVLDLMVWNGVILGFLIFFGMAYWLFTCYRKAKSVPQIYLCLAIFSIFVHAMLEYPLSYMYFLIPLGLMSGALDISFSITPIIDISRKYILLATALVIGLVGMIGYEYLKVEENTRILHWELAKIGTDKIESVAPELRLLTHWQNYLRVARIEAHSGMSPEELHSMAQVVERFPYIALIYELALAYGLNQQPKAAHDTLAWLCHLQTERVCAKKLRDWQAAVQAHPELAAVVLPSTGVTQ